MPRGTQQAGIITFNDWTYMPDGRQYMAAFGSWETWTDKELHADGLKTADRWAAVAVAKDGNVTAIIPGCRVRGFVAVAERPAVAENDVFRLAE